MGQGEFRSFGSQRVPQPEVLPPEGLTLPAMSVPVRLVIDRGSLEQLGYEVAAVVAAAVQDGIRAGIDPDGDTLPPDEFSQDSSGTPTPASGA
jgi:hypothetical protein